MGKTEYKELILLHNFLVFTADLEEMAFLLKKNLTALAKKHSGRIKRINIDEQIKKSDKHLITSEKRTTDITFRILPKLER